MGELRGPMIRKSRFVLLPLFFVLSLAITSQALADKTADKARSIYERAILLLNRTGGIASFYTLPGRSATTWHNLKPLPPNEVEKALDTVVHDLLDVIRLDPSIKAAHYFLGVAYLKKMDGDKAIKEFYTAIDVEPHRELSYTLLCELLWKYKRYPDAIGVVHRYQIELPKSRDNIANLAGYTYYLMGDYHKSLLYGLFLMQTTSNPEGSLMTAASYYCLGNRKAADELFNKLEEDSRIRGKMPAIMNDLRKKCGDKESEK
jgi:tetratricopeptide (TPR) repeat protein